MDKTHLLFDFFGTLVHYVPSPALEAYRRTYDVFAQAGYSGDYAEFVSLWSGVYTELETDARRTHQEFTMHTQAAVVAERGLGRDAERDSAALVERLFRTYLEDWNQGVAHIETVPGMIERLADRYTLGIVSNTHDTELVPAHLKRMAVFQHMDDIVTSAELGVRKPAAAIFEQALERLGVQASACVYVGDTFEADYQGATNAGLSCLLIDPERKSPVPELHRIDSIEQVPERILALG